MRAHIVGQSAVKDGWILGRICNMLAARYRWTISDTYNSKADIQYIIPYLGLPKHLDAPTPIAALFDHREPPTDNIDAWYKCAEKVDLRLTFAQQYYDELKHFGPTEIITPGFDLNFRMPVRPVLEPVVGISGRVVESGRKGEWLVKELLQSRLAKHIQIKIIGSGWDGEPKLIDKSKIVEWYQSLQVYLCPSVVEGVPYGPLEALACGVKVVIPRGVGLLDSLPDLDGIIRYKRGDYDSMVHALQKALCIKCDRHPLRSCVAHCAAEVMCKSHYTPLLDYTSKGASIS